MRGALGALLGLEPDLEVVGYAADGEEAIAEARRLRPDVCLMDVQMPGIDGLEATRGVREASEGTRVLIVTTFAKPGYLRQALEAGASGFVVKDTPADQLAEAVRAVHAGQRVVDPALAEASLFDGANPLSERERQVLRRRGRGAYRPSDRRRGVPLGGNGTQPALLGDREDRRAQPHGGRAHRPRQRVDLGCAYATLRAELTPAQR